MTKKTKGTPVVIVQDGVAFGWGADIIDMDDFAVDTPTGKAEAIAGVCAILENFDAGARLPEVYTLLDDLMANLIEILQEVQNG
jgi:hypothetical protein